MLYVRDLSEIATSFLISVAILMDIFIPPRVVTQTASFLASLPGELHSQAPPQLIDANICNQKAGMEPRNVANWNLLHEICVLVCVVCNLQYNFWSFAVPDIYVNTTKSNVFVTKKSDKCSP